MIVTNVSLFLNTDSSFQSSSFNIYVRKALKYKAGNEQRHAPGFTGDNCAFRLKWYCTDITAEYVFDDVLSIRVVTMNLF